MSEYYGQHGWKEFLENREDILKEYDRLLGKVKNRPIQTAHGTGVEAFLRTWLGEFLPKKYGVTSGYVIPNLYEMPYTLYHQDIIIYNQLDAPVLWTEGNEDTSHQGRYRAIPAEYVLFVFEVKSRLNRKTIRDAVAKLEKLNDYETMLNAHFRSGVIFVELKCSDNNSKAIAKELISAKRIKSFFGGSVLRFEGDTSCGAVIEHYGSDQFGQTDLNKCVPIAKAIDTLDIKTNSKKQLVMAQARGGVKVTNTGAYYGISKQYVCAYSDEESSFMLTWSKSAFSSFCLRLLRSLEGKQLENMEKSEPFGTVFDEIVG